MLSGPVVFMHSFCNKIYEFLSSTRNKKYIDLFLMELLGLIEHMEPMEHLELIRLLISCYQVIICTDEYWDC
jgi:hypothetical protein